MGPVGTNTVARTLVKDIRTLAGFPVRADALAGMLIELPRRLTLDLFRALAATGLVVEDLGRVAALLGFVGTGALAGFPVEALRSGALGFVRARTSAG